MCVPPGQLRPWEEWTEANRHFQASDEDPFWGPNLEKSPEAPPRRLLKRLIFYMFA